MPPIPAAMRRMRLCVGLTVAGGMLLIAGLATGLAGETSRLTGSRGWNPIVVSAEILTVAGMSCGLALLVALAAWHLSIQWRRPRDQPAARLPEPSCGMPVQDPPHPAAASGPHVPVDLTGPRVARPQRASEVAHTLAPRDDTDGETAAWVSAQQDVTQIKDLYRAAEQMGDAEFDAHWEELRRRQYELILEYFEEAGLGGADIGQSAG